MRLFQVGVSLAGVLLWGAVGRCQSQSWRKFSPPKGEFTVLLPGRPEAEKEVEPTPEGISTTYTFTVERESGVFSVGYSELPPATGILPSQLLMDQFRDGMVEELGTAELLGERNIAWKNVPGRAITLRDKAGWIYTTRVYRVKQRLYHLLAVTALGEQKRSAAVIQSFLGSFMLLSTALKSGKPIAWSPFSSAAGRFSVLLPGLPTQQTILSPSAAGAMKLPVFVRLGEAVKYTVTYQDFADPQVAQNPEQTLDGFQKGMLRSINRAWAEAKAGATSGSSVPTAQSRGFSQRHISLQGWPGREIRFMEPTAMAHRVRFYLVRQRIYVLSTATARENQAASAPDVEKFLKSLTLLNTAPPAPAQGNLS